MRAFFAGLLLPLRAPAALSAAAGLWRYIIIPIAINIVVGLTLYASLLYAGLRSIESAVATLPEWAAPLAFLLQAVLVIGLLIATGFLLVRLGVLFGSPFYARLSELLEQQQTGAAPPAEPLSATGVARDLWRSVLFELKKLTLVLLIGGLLLLTNLIPVAGQAVSAVGGITLGVLISCLDFFDPPLERRRLSFRSKLGYIWRTLPGSAGFGLAALALVSIPLVNLLAIPLCIVAGTLFFCSRPRDEPLSPQRRR